MLGLMPHPERCAEAVLGNEDGLELFRSLVEATVEAHAAAGPERERRGQVPLLRLGTR